MNVATVRPFRTTATAVAAFGLVLAAPVGNAGAEPPGFPDLNTFSVAAVDDYFVTTPHVGPDSRTVKFSTPFNMNCSIDAQDPKPANAPTGVRCTGDLPDSGHYQFGKCVVGVVSDIGLYGAYRVAPRFSNCPPFTAAGKQLDIGQKLTYGNITCAVGADQLTACLDTTSGQHGFVLKPSGNEEF
ncbi:hypothetical protein [[Mycobacterium] vasticus]|uniref:Uncharacterized protein n=1 Tax=[Mycobacterium] vasticus TaxID=2875777 RepID=A0ABU5Z262_9MYCO|nr:hypothetical protein [Mycolicibacter sp. MYC017]MEB3071463.1 hypothetical protein [Mycolicibacter sp. MYC017]